MSPPLLGSGLLAIWNGVATGMEREFVRWHIEEHMPERLSVPGFLRGRRYRAVEGSPKYFNFYEVRDAGVLNSDEYLSRLNSPTPRTRAIVPHFTGTVRTPCQVIYSHGRGLAGWVLTLRLSGKLLQHETLLGGVGEHWSVCAVHYLERLNGSFPATSESRMRSGPDESAVSIVLVEGVSVEALREVSNAVLRGGALESASGAVAAQSGIYQLDYLLSLS